jgi:hypothetical protein
MARKKRYFRCPQCAFEHPLFSEAELREDLKVVDPWACPICKASGFLPDDGSVPRDVSNPEFREARQEEHGVSCPSYSWTCLEDFTDASPP